MAKGYLLGVDADNRRTIELPLDYTDDNPGTETSIVVQRGVDDLMTFLGYDPERWQFCNLIHGESERRWYLILRDRYPRANNETD